MKSIYFLAGLSILPLCGPALMLDEAVQIALEASPGMHAARARADAAAAEIPAVSAWHNPEVELEIEGLGRGDRGTGSAEYSLMLSQEFPTSGKNRRAAAVHSYTAEAARFAAAETRLEFECAVRLAFMDLQAASETVRVREQQLALAAEFTQAVQDRHKAGAASELETLRAEMLLEAARSEAAGARTKQEAARRKTIALTGLTDCEQIRFDFFAPPGDSGSVVLHETHPLLRRVESMERQSAAEVALAKSAAIPDLTLGGGVRYEREGDVQSWLVSVSVPLPLFNRGRAETLAAGLRMEAVRAERDQIRRDLMLELEALRAEFETADAKAVRFHRVLLPKAEQAAALVREGYAAGRYSWQETVEAQQALADVQISGIEAQYTALRARAGLLKFRAGESL